MKQRINHFLIGGFLFANLHGFFTDWLGQAGYIQYVQNHWINTPIWFHPAVIVFFFAATYKRKGGIKWLWTK
jgi:hypothetical protein